jgi:hypothetical protein
VPASQYPQMGVLTNLKYSLPYHRKAGATEGKGRERGRGRAVLVLVGFGRGMILLRCVAVSTPKEFLHVFTHTCALTDNDICSPSQWV